MRLTLVWVRRNVCLQETCVLHYSLATQMLKRTKKGSSPHHSVRLECVCQKNCRSKTLEEPRHCPYGRGAGLAISLTSYPSSKEESVPLQMVAHVHCCFLMSIPFIFLYYFSYFDQSCNQIPNRNSLFSSVFEDISTPCWEGVLVGTCPDWSHCVHSQRQRDEC